MLIVRSNVLAHRGQHRLMHINHGSDRDSDVDSDFDNGSDVGVRNVRVAAVGGRCVFGWWLWPGCMQHVARLQVASGGHKLDAHTHTYSASTALPGSAPINVSALICEARHVPT